MDQSHQTIELDDQVSVTCTYEEVVRADSYSDADVEVTSHPRFGTDKLRLNRLEKGNNDYEIMKKIFVSKFRNNVDIVGVYKKNYDWSDHVMDHARMETFRVFANAVACKNGGDANVKYGWYGGSRDEIREILSHGFRRFENKTVSYGRGVYLSPANNPMESVETSVVDSEGVMHLLLCRVILGNSETIPYGSQKDQPSSMEFDSGASPTNYVIWEPYMNSHILPLYMITFKVDSLKEARSLKIPMSSPHMSINGLIRQLTNYLSPSKMSLIKKLHHDYYQNKVSRFRFIRDLRKVAGDDVLRAIVQRLR